MDTPGRENETGETEQIQNSKAAFGRTRAQGSFRIRRWRDEFCLDFGLKSLGWATFSDFRRRD